MLYRREAALEVVHLVARAEPLTLEELELGDLARHRGLRVAGAEVVLLAVSLVLVELAQAMQDVLVDADLPLLEQEAVVRVERALSRRRGDGPLLARLWTRHYFLRHVL